MSALQIPQLAPFYAPQLDQGLLLANETSADDDYRLAQRDGYCLPNYNSCSTLAAAYGGACCTTGSVCTKDKANNIACCTIGATCTGTVGHATATAATATSTSTSSTVTSPNTAPASFVPNAFFPYPYIPTSYINSAACASAVSACAANYALCTNDLTGQMYGVTVSGPDGAGVTVAPTVAPVGLASATSLCSSLSSQACGGTYTSNCAQYGTATTSGGAFIV